MRLHHLSHGTGCDILAKAEFMNPGGSVKDRAALSIISLAEQSAGALRPGGTVVEGTAGNTGIGMAHVCRAKGYKCVIYMPNTQSPEKVQLLKALGADVRTVPAVPFDDPNSMVSFLPLPFLFHFLPRSVVELILLVEQITTTLPGGKRKGWIMPCGAINSTMSLTETPIMPQQGQRYGSRQGGKWMPGRAPQAQGAHLQGWPSI